MDKRNHFFGELVTEATLDQSFDWVEDADQNLAADTGMEGIHAGLVVSEQAVPDLTVQVTAGVATGPDGERIAVTAPTSTVDCSVDRYGSSTAVTLPGNEKYLAVYARFTRLATNPAVDDNGVTVYTRQYEAAEFLVEAGAEALIGAAVRPALLTDAIHLADVYLVNAQAAITNADLTVTRRGDWLREVLTNLGGAAMVHGTPQTACAALWQAIDALAGATGADNVGTDDYTTANAHVTWAGATVQDALEATADAIDGHIVGAAPNHPASAISTAVIAGTPESEAAPSTVQAVLANVFTHLNARTERATVERVIQPWDIGSEGGVNDDTQTRLRGSTLTGTLAGGSWGKAVTLADIASCLHPGAYPLSSPVAANNTIITAGLFLPKVMAGSALVVRDSTVLSTKQRRLIVTVDADSGVAGSGNAGKAYLWDPHDPASGVVAMATLGSLPVGAAQAWQAEACCSNGTTLFVLFNAPNANPALTDWRVQAYDVTINAMTKIAAWPATGINPTPTFTGRNGGVGQVHRASNICIASATKVATCNGWVNLNIAGRPAISVFNVSNGLDLDQGDGTVTPGAAVVASGGICSDGSTIYWTAQDGGGTFAAVLQSSRIADPDTSPVGWANIALGNASGVAASRCHSICWDGEAVWCPLEDGTVITASTVYKGAAYTAYAAHAKIDFLGACCFDGLRVWIQGHGQGTDGIVGVGIDASLAHAFSGGFALSDLSPRLVSLTRVVEASADPVDTREYGPMLFDGDAAWCILNDGKFAGSADMLGYARAIRASSRR